MPLSNESLGPLDVQSLTPPPPPAQNISKAMTDKVAEVINYFPFLRFSPFSTGMGVGVGVGGLKYVL